MNTYQQWFSGNLTCDLDEINEEIAAIIKETGKEFIEKNWTNQQDTFCLFVYNKTLPLSLMIVVFSFVNYTLSNVITEEFQQKERGFLCQKNYTMNYRLLLKN